MTAFRYRFNTLESYMLAFGGPSPPPAPPPPVDPAAIAARTKAAQDAAFNAEQGGRASTILTGAQGATLGQNNLASNILLGGGKPQ